jgi:hypothetical protein
MSTSSQRVLIETVPDFAQQEVALRGCVSRIRVLGKTAFLVLKDRSGEVQCAAGPEAPELPIDCEGRHRACSWTPEESKVESCEHQDDANIHCQPFPESVSEEQEIYTDYDGCHRHHVKHASYLSAHFSKTASLVAAELRLVGEVPSSERQLRTLLSLPRLH